LQREESLFDLSVEVSVGVAQRFERFIHLDELVICVILVDVENYVLGSAGILPAFLLSNPFRITFLRNATR